MWDFILKKVVDILRNIHIHPHTQNNSTHTHCQFVLQQVIKNILKISQSGCRRRAPYCEGLNGQQNKHTQQPSLTGSQKAGNDDRNISKVLGQIAGWWSDVPGQRLWRRRTLRTMNEICFTCGCVCEREREKEEMRGWVSPNSWKKLQFFCGCYPKKDINTSVDISSNAGNNVALFWIKKRLHS